MLQSFWFKFKDFTDKARPVSILSSIKRQFILALLTSQSTSPGSGWCTCVSLSLTCYIYVHLTDC